MSLQALPRKYETASLTTAGSSADHIAPRFIGQGQSHFGDSSLSSCLVRLADSFSCMAEVEDAPLGFAAITDHAKVDRVELVTLANGPGVQVLGKGLAWLVVFR